MLNDFAGRRQLGDYSSAVAQQIFFAELWRSFC
jgi:hypothetical protein